MRTIFIITLLILLSLNSFSQRRKQAFHRFEKKNALTVGILQGGGSLVGVDFETLITDRFGVQFGAGYIGFGGGLNYHLKQSIRSSFISLQYWNQGIGSTFAQNIVGASYVFRGERWFTFQIGMGVPLQKGPALPRSYDQPPVMLMYSIGAYFPI